MSLTFSRLGKPQASSRTPERPISAPIIADDDGVLFLRLGTLAELDQATVQRRRKTKNGAEGAPYEGVDLIDATGTFRRVIEVPPTDDSPAAQQLRAAAAADGVRPAPGEILRAEVDLSIHLPQSRGWLTIDPVAARFSLVRPAAPAPATPASAPKPPAPPKRRAVKK